MHADLEAIRDAWDKSTGDGRDEEGTRAMVDAYVADHPEAFAGLDKFDLPTLVNLLSSYRNNGEEERMWETEVWLLHRYEPQKIGGTYEATVRLPGL